jgi:hypothetical protein
MESAQRHCVCREKLWVARHLNRAIPLAALKVA